MVRDPLLACRVEPGVKLFKPDPTSFRHFSHLEISFAGHDEDREGSAMLVQNSLTSQKGKKSSCSMLVQYNSLTIRVKS